VRRAADGLGLVRADREDELALRERVDRARNAVHVLAREEGGRGAFRREAGEADAARARPDAEDLRAGDVGVAVARAQKLVLREGPRAIVAVRRAQRVEEPLRLP